MKKIEGEVVDRMWREEEEGTGARVPYRSARESFVLCF